MKTDTLSLARSLAPLLMPPLAAALAEERAETQRMVKAAAAPLQREVDSLRMTVAEGLTPLQRDQIGRETALHAHPLFGRVG